MIKFGHVLRHPQPENAQSLSELRNRYGGFICVDVHDITHVRTTYLTSDGTMWDDVSALSAIKSMNEDGFPVF